jgi:ATP-dependent Clp protease ATP-binding subunit ClpC
MVFDRFTDPARRAMALSRMQCQRLCTPYIATEHILLGLLELETMKDVFTQLGIEPAKVRDEVERRVLPVHLGAKEPGPGQLPFTDRARKVVELAVKEADGLGHDCIDIDHLLLGLLREGKGVAAEVLRSMGLDLERVRAVARERNRTTPSEGRTGGESGPRKKRPWWNVW